MAGRTGLGPWLAAALLLVAGLSWAQLPDACVYNSYPLECADSSAPATCGGGCSHGTLVWHEAGGTAGGGAWDFGGTEFADCGHAGLPCSPQHYPVLRAWTWSEFSLVNTGCEPQDGRLWMLNLEHDRGVGTWPGYWVNEAPSFFGWDYDGCPLSVTAPPIVAELSFVDSPSEGTTAHFGWQAIASVNLEVADDWNLDRISGAGGAGNVVPLVPIPAPLSLTLVGDNAVDPGFEDFDVEMPASPNWYTENGADDSSRPLIDGAGLMYAHGVEPLSSLPSQYAGWGSDPATPDRFLPFVVAWGAVTRVAFPRALAAGEATHVVTLLHYRDAGLADTSALPVTASPFLGSWATSAHLTPPILIACFDVTPPSPCLGQEVCFDAGCSIGATGWAWDFGDGSTDAGPTPCHAYATAGDYTITLTVSNGLDVDVTTRTVTVVDSATACFGFEPAAPCEGEEVCFDGSCSGGATSWVWDFGDGATGSGLAPCHVYTGPGRFEVSLVVDGDCGADTTVRSLDVGPVPTACFLADAPAPCEGQQVCFDAGCSTDARDLDWDFGDGQTGSGPSPCHAYATPGDYEVRLTATSDCGSDVALVTVSVAAGPVACFSSDPPEACPAEQVCFDSACSTGATDSQWDFGDGATGSGPAPCHAYGAAGEYTVTLTATGDCGSDVTSSSVLILPPPVACFEVDPARPCVGQDACFDAGCTTDATDYQWDFGDGQLGSGPTPCQSYAAPGDHQVTLTATGDCGVDQQVFTVTVVETAVACLSADPAEACPGEEVCFDAACSSGGAIYAWDFGDGATDTGERACHAFAGDGDHQVVLSLSGACGDDTQGLSYRVNPLPVACFSQAPLDPFEGDEVCFDATCSSEATGWEWDFGDGATATGSTTCHVFVPYGSYDVSLVATNGCGSDELVRPVEVEGPWLLRNHEPRSRSFVDPPLAGLFPGSGCVSLDATSDRYILGIRSGDIEPDATICPDRTRPLVFYELDWCVTTFRIDKESPCTLRLSW